MQSAKLWKILIFIFLLAWLSFLLAQKIDLTTADLGRHLANGKWVVENHFDLFEKNSPVHENFYSYTNLDFPVPNHHWGSGVVFFFIYKLAGFSGLSIFYILLGAAAFAIFFYIAKRESNFTIAALLSLLLLPLIAERREVRPEIFSYFFAALFLLLLWKYARQEISWRWLFVLPLLMIFWVNLHVYFFLGIFLVGAFFLDNLIGRRVVESWETGTILVFTALAALANPFEWKGIAYPLEIFRNYGYTIVENKSVSFVENYGIVNPNFFLIKAVLVALILGFVLLFFTNRKKISIPYSLLALFFGALGWLAIRNFTLLGLFTLPVLAFNFENVFTPSRAHNSPVKENGIAIAYICLAAIAVFSNFQFISAHSAGRGIGLAKGNLAAAEFLKSEKIAGPIFNNYDIGGYLIWSLPANEKVFADNRPEAYPDSFFGQVYKPMQENPDVFKKIDERYNFNAIVFSRNDITPWGMNFLKMIKENPDWTKVFEDNYAVIYKKFAN